MRDTPWGLTLSRSCLGNRVTLSGGGARNMHMNAKVVEAHNSQLAALVMTVAVGDNRWLNARLLCEAYCLVCY